MPARGESNQRESEQIGLDSTTQRQSGELGMNLAKQLGVEVTARQRDPHFAYNGANQSPDLQQFQPNGGALRFAQFAPFESKSGATSAAAHRPQRRSTAAVDCCANTRCWFGRRTTSVVPFSCSALWRWPRPPSTPTGSKYSFPPKVLARDSLPPPAPQQGIVA